MIKIEIRKAPISMREAADRIGVSRQRMHQLLKEGRINGAYQFGDKKVWVIPHDFQLNPRSNQNATDSAH